MKAATPEDIANVIKLLERLRTGEMNLIPSVASLHERHEDAGTALLQRVEGVLSEHLRRMQEPLGTGGAAFPVPHQEDVNGSVRQWGELGMTLRDYFAAKALPRVIQSCVTDTRDTGETLEDFFARRSYEMADAMLKARAR